MESEDEQTFYRGDRVRHVTTGKVMRVVEVKDSTFLYCVRCEWVAEGGKGEGEFRRDQLRLMDAWG